MKKQKTAFIYGNFNVIHSGHVRLFRYAKTLADKLIVGVIKDDVARASRLFDQNARLENVRANVYVDEVHLLQSSLENFIKTKKPNLIIKGREHEKQFNSEIEWVEKYGGQVVFSSGEATPSLSETIFKKNSNNVFQIKNTAQTFAFSEGINVENLLTIN